MIDDPKDLKTLERISELVVYHPDFRNAHDQFGEAIERGKWRKPAPGLMIAGPTGCGKSTVAKEIAGLLAKPLEKDSHHLPLLLVTTPSDPSIKSVGHELLSKLSSFVKPNSKFTKHEYRSQIIPKLKERAVQAVVFDEIQHFVEHRPSEEVLKATDWTKVLIEEIEIPVFLIGLTKGLKFLEGNSQLDTRFSARVAMKWFGYSTDSERLAFRSTLGAFEGKMKFGDPLDFAGEELASRFFWATFGVSRHLKNLAAGAVEIALRDGRHSLQQKDLEAAFTKTIWAFGVGQLNPFNPRYVGRDLTRKGEPFYRLNQSRITEARQ